MTLTGNGLALSDELIARCGDRAAGYDRENRFFTEDFEELRKAGYLTMAVPKELGWPRHVAGRGLSRAAAARLSRAGHRAGHQHASVLDGCGRGSQTHGRRLAGVDAARRGGGRGLRGGPRRGGQRSSPLPLHGQGRARRRRVQVLGTQDLRQPHPGVDTARSARHARRRPGGPKVIHAFLPRDAKGYSIKETWDTLGMRATRSDDTLLDGAFVPDKYVARV